MLPELHQVSENAVGDPYDLNIPLHPHAQPPQALRDQVRESFFEASGVVGARYDPFDAGGIYDLEVVTQARVAGATVASNDRIVISVALDLNIPVRCSPEIMARATEILARMQLARTPPPPARPRRR